MNFYYRDPKRLESELSKFIGGQFQMETREKLTFRGEIKDCIALSGRRVLISLGWLCERRYVFDDSWTLNPKWFLMRPPPGSHCLDVEFSVYYLQPNEDRIKMWSRLNEICRFFKSDDVTNLVPTETGFTRRWYLPEMALRRQIATSLFAKK